jgi:hypothetical protein
MSETRLPAVAGVEVAMWVVGQTWYHYMWGRRKSHPASCSDTIQNCLSGGGACSGDLSAYHQRTSADWRQIYVPSGMLATRFLRIVNNGT